MSWQDDATLERACPCGAGTYQVLQRSDDWSRHEEHWTMRCTACQVAYGLHSFTVHKDGMAARSYAWLPRAIIDEMTTLASDLSSKRAELSTFARNELTTRWLEHFAGKTKKRIWAELTEDGRAYPALATFYTHVRQSSVDQVLRRYLESNDLPTVVRVLHLDRDIELTMRLRSVQELEEKGKECERMARRQAFV